jgi:hypothetical protein
MKKIDIKIPDNLTTEQEVIQIAKRLTAKGLPSGRKLLGTGVEIRDMITQINIIRESTEKPIKTFTCSVCDTITDARAASYLWTNYGGRPKKKPYCSKECCQKVIELVGGSRVSIKRSGLKNLTFF